MERDQVMCDLCGDDVAADTVAEIRVAAALGDPTDVRVEVPQGCYPCRSGLREMAQHRVDRCKRKEMRAKGVPLGEGVIP